MIFQDPSKDADGDGILDVCQADCPTDLDNDGDTDFNDILIVLSNFGSDGGDADDDGDVDFNDLITLLSAFGLCP